MASIEVDPERAAGEVCCRASILSSTETEKLPSSTLRYVRLKNVSGCPRPSPVDSTMDLQIEWHTPSPMGFVVEKAQVSSSISHDTVCHGFPGPDCCI